MAQVGIREYDAKVLFSQYKNISYNGILITSKNEINIIPDTAKSYTVKPDQLFGKRGKYNLIGLDLSIQGVKERLLHHYHKEVTIGGVHGVLDTFLVEEYIPHTEEYYISCTAHRTHNKILFNTLGGVDIESHRDNTRTLNVPIGEQCTISMIADAFDIKNPSLLEHIADIYNFFILYGCCSVEINPCVIATNGSIHNLDMVVFVDSTEHYRQSQRRGGLSFPPSFGKTYSEEEAHIALLDRKTGASLKYSNLHDNAPIRLILGGGGASVILFDTFYELGLVDKIGNYGELSGNPSMHDNAAYIDIVIKKMLSSTASLKALCIIGGIANFTDINALVQGLIHAIENNKKEFLEQEITIIFRRGGVHDTLATKMLEKYCIEHHITHEISDGSIPLTKPLHTLAMNFI